MTAVYAGWETAADALESHLGFDQSKDLMAHWRGIWPQSADRLPERQMIDPLAMVPSLPHVFILEREATGGRLLYRLAGEEINARYETSIVGRYLDEITPKAILPRVDAYFRACPERPAAVLLSGILFMERDTPGYGERMLLPIQDSVTGHLGLVGITMQSRLFPDRLTAMSRSTRVLRIYPLDGAPIEETDMTGT